MNSMLLIKHFEIQEDVVKLRKIQAAKDNEISTIIENRVNSEIEKLKKEAYEEGYSKGFEKGKEESKEEKEAIEKKYKGSPLND